MQPNALEEAQAAGPKPVTKQRMLFWYDHLSSECYDVPDKRLDATFSTALEGLLAKSFIKQVYCTH